MDQKLRKTLRALSLELRHILEGRYDGQGAWHPGDLERRLNELGIWRDREPKPAGQLPHLSIIDKTARELVDGYIQLRQEAGVSRTEESGEEQGQV